MPDELTQRPTAAPLVNSAMDDLYNEAGHEGLEGIKPTDMILPRLAMLQPTSPLSQEDGYKSGDLVNILTSYNFGKSIEFYPLLFWSSRINWVDESLGGDIDCQSRDAENGTKKDEAHAGGVCGSCQFSKWSDSGDPPRCTEFKNLLIRPYNAASWSEEEITPIVFSGKRTGVKPILQMLSSAMLLRRNGRSVPLYASSWKLETVKMQNDNGTYFIPKLTRGAYVEDVAVFQALRSMYTDMKAAQSKIVVPQEAEPAADAGGGDF